MSTATAIFVILAALVGLIYVAVQMFGPAAAFSCIMLGVLLTFAVIVLAILLCGGEA